MASRVYSTIEARQQGAQTLVATWDDVVRAVTLSMQEKRPCNLLLMADLFASSTLTLPATLSSFSLNGGGKYTINIRNSHTRWCKVDTNAVLSNVAIRTLDGAVLTQMFGVGEGAALMLHRVNADARKGGITDVFGLTGIYASGLVVDSCTFSEVRNVFAADGSSRRWDRCTITDTTFLSDIDYSSSTTLGRGSKDVYFRFCEFSRINGALALDMGGDSTGCVFESIGAFAQVTTNSNGIKGHTFLSCSYGGTKLLGGADVWVGDGVVEGPDASLTVYSLATSGALSVGGMLSAPNATIAGNLAANTVNASGISATINSSLAAASATTLGVSGASTFGGSSTFSTFIVNSPAVAGVSGASPTITPTSSNMWLVLSAATGSMSLATSGYAAGTLLWLRVASSAGSTVTLPDNTANGVRLVSTWTPAANATLSLVFDGAYWLETGRSAT